MKIIKKINNNAVYFIDSVGNEAIAIGKGIGFPSVPYELDDLSIIQRTFYGINPVYLDLLNQIPNDIFEIASEIVEIFRMKINPTISSNLVFTLADHLNFAIEREKKNIQIENPLHYDIQHLYEEEYEIGLTALKIIHKKLNFRLSKMEASNIALHLVNAEAVAGTVIKVSKFDIILEDIISIIGEHFQIFINKNDVSYSRFVSHLQYLIKREQDDKKLSTSNHELFQSVIYQYPETYDCVLKICRYFENELKMYLGEEEILYLILHTNRLCVREDCNHMGITPTQK